MTIRQELELMPLSFTNDSLFGMDRMVGRFGSITYAPSLEALGSELELGFRSGIT